MLVSMDTCRDEILAVAANLAARSADGTFSVDDVVRELAHQGSSYQESTIRTHITSVMCADAPVSHRSARSARDHVLGPAERFH